MICCIVLKPTHKSKKLLLKRSRQREFSEILEAQLRCPVFVFNYTDITYVFFEDVIVVPSALKITADFMITIQATDLRVLDVSDTPDYFWNEVKNKLTSLAISSRKSKANHRFNFFFLYLGMYSWLSYLILGQGL